MRRKNSTSKRKPPTKKLTIRKLNKKIIKIKTQENVAVSEKEKRIIILDGANLACGYTSSSIFSVKGLKIAMDFFEKMGHKIYTIIPQRRLEPNMTDDHHAIQELEKTGKLKITPCKDLPENKSCSYDDRFIIEVAIRYDGAVISNDNYKDLLGESAEFNNIIMSRVIGFTWVDDDLFIPSDPYGKKGPSLDEILHK